MSDWQAILRQAVEADPRGITGVAEVIGVSRAAVSLVVNDKYPARTDAIAAKVLDRYDRYPCPHSGDSVSRVDCRRQALRAAPTSSPRDMRAWRACQACANKPKE